MTFNDDLNYDLFGPPKQAVSGLISCPMWGGVPGIGMAQLGPGRRNRDRWSPTSDLAGLGRYALRVRLCLL